MRPFTAHAIAQGATLHPAACASGLRCWSWTAKIWKIRP